MVIRVYKSVNDVDKAEWNEIVGRNRIICRHEYLAAIEASKINDCRYFYPVVYDGDQIIGHACLYYISTELDLFCEGIAKRVINSIRKVWKSFMIMRSIECGTPVALGNTFSFRNGVDRHSVIDAIVESAEELAKREGVRVLLFRDFYKGDLDEYNRLKKNGYVQVNNLPTVRMRLKWQNFEGYMKAMRHEYRRKARQRLQRFDREDLTMEVISDFSTYSKELSVLWKNAYDNASEYRREYLLEDFFRNISDGMKDDSRIVAAKAGGKIIGFALLLLGDDVLDWVFCGLDYDCNKEYSVYYSMIYRIIEFAIASGFKEIDFGITTVDAKIDVGAVVESQYMYMKYMSCVSKKVVPSVFSLMTPESKIVKRNVFK